MSETNYTPNIGEIFRIQPAVSGALITSAEIKASTYFENGRILHSATLTNKTGSTLWMIIVRGILPPDGLAYANLAGIVAIIECHSSDGIQPATIDFAETGYPFGDDHFSVLIVSDITTNVTFADLTSAPTSVCAVTYS